ncbi:hypothetical protein [Tahibacter soli]|uniref:DUF4345 domain-containing protein n=1 Tax=Tahibacter soli TaxID=2983605 RepID=A0A9X4BJ64_9GAMM|nr:hypothetical protein [Tahibacter soli]MDC8011834.1 hypothetical protein [Tahibacter soli]
MLVVYLWANAVIYAVFGVMSAVAPAKIAASLGLSGDASGKVEFFTVYAGLELGVAAFYAWAAYASPQAQRVALMFSLCLYAGLVLFRAIGMAMHWPVSGTILGVAALEALLLAGAVALTLSSRP